ncbi:MAG: ABC transporter ATP-binding protein [Egibacteraceae bacterium]
MQVELGGFRLDVELAVAAGEMVGVLGPNGAGKTTLLRALAGLVPLAGGRVTLGGEVLEDPAASIRVLPERRSVGVVFQDYRLFPHLSALDNVAFGIRSRGVGRSEARQRAQEWLAGVGLGAQGASRPGELSGGQAQRVALARALATEPALLLLDEPLSALDAIARAGARRELRRVLAGYQGVRLLITHDPLEAMALADRLVILEAGRIAQSGRPREVVARPRSVWAADLVGVNLLRGQARRDRIELAGGGSLEVAGSREGEVFAVVHPRAVVLHSRQPAGPRNVWRGVVQGLDPAGPVGDRVRVQVEGLVPMVAEVTPVTVSRLGLKIGGGVWVSVKAAEITVYPA